MSYTYKNSIRAVYSILYIFYIIYKVLSLKSSVKVERRFLDKALAKALYVFSTLLYILY